MTHTELNDKINRSLSELRSDIETFVTENAKFKVGDVVSGGIGAGFSNNKVFFVIKRVGYDHTFDRESGRIVYYGLKLLKNGEVSNMDMDSNVGTPENSLRKTTLVLKDKVLSFVESHGEFKYDIKIKI